MTSLIQFKDQSQISKYAQQQKKKLVIYDQFVLDVTSFADHHPGGSGLVLNYQQKNIASEMDTHHPLSKSVANSMIIGTLSKSFKKVIDPEKSLVEQIWKMDHDTYLNNVHRPNWVFSKSPRMFETEILERFSYCSWFNIFYVPYLLMFIYYKNYVEDHWENVKILNALVAFIFGVFIFSLTEYLLHRFLFHSEKYIFDLKVMRCAHFIMHGIHHMFPFDPYRLVLPPIFTAFVLTVGYFTIYRIAHWSNPVIDLIFWTGFLTGYVGYDLTHYALHHIDTSKSKNNIFHKIQRHHNQHHYGVEDAGYGVSTPFWDHIFRTLYKNAKRA